MPTPTRQRAIYAAAFALLLALSVAPGAAVAKKQKNGKNRPTTGRIEISTNPGGYPIIIDGRPAGETTDYVRAIDLAVRHGGEEFVVVMPDTDLEDARRIAERIRLHVAGAPFRVMGGEELLSVTISIGVACSSGEGDSSQALIKRADEAV